MKFQPERLQQIRINIGINKAEAARQLNMSAMGYGRYEKGEREPSYQTVCFIAQTFQTTTDYLYGLSDDAHSESITITYAESPELFTMVSLMQKNKEYAKRLLAYSDKIRTD